MAVKYLISDGVWSSDLIWSTTSGGSNDTTHPVLGDDVKLDQNSGTGNLTINTASACTSLDATVNSGYSGTIAFGIQTLTVSGAVTFSSTMATTGTTGKLICNATATLTANGRTLTCWLEFQTNAAVYTFADAWSIGGKLRLNTGGTYKLDGADITVAGGLDVSGATTAGGTAGIILTGGTWSGGGTLRNDLTFGNGATITVSGSVRFAEAAMTNAGATVTTTGSTLSLDQVTNPSTFDVAGITWNNIANIGGVVLILNSLLSAAKYTLWSTNGQAFQGTHGFTVGTLDNVAIAAGRTVTFQYAAASPPVYTVTGALNVTGLSSGARLTLASSSAVAGERAIITLQGGASQNVNYVNATRIDSSGGDTIHTPTGDVSTSLNWDNQEPAGSGLMWLS